MWPLMGIRSTASFTNCKLEHPVDHPRSLYFVSDFPHLVKCLRNGLLTSNYKTPAGEVTILPFYYVDSAHFGSTMLKMLKDVRRSEIKYNHFL
ncbi:hypothetical protein HPB48_026104 [Haemaphysalis longicornis]|uniref:Transposable element P transposase n=1 Tax=Haemaphysalis longicornis TaxID=44386 RepID=A0A9J6H8R0_HAELO|nr:hypothetical protein HPB48_026104 [Haemaphysalis longicornis]